MTIAARALRARSMAERAVRLGIARASGRRLPYSVTFILTHRCNFQCDYCDIPAAAGDEMTAAYRQEVAEIAPESVRNVGKGALEYRATEGKSASARMGALIGNAERKAATVASDSSVTRADGLPLAATSEIHLSLGLRDAKGEKPLGDMAQDVTFRLDRVAEWPSGGKTAETEPK